MRMMKNYPVLLEALFFSAAGLLFQVVVLSMLRGDALSLGTTLLFLAPLANGVILAIVGEPMNVYGVRGSAVLLKATICALLISLAFATIGIFWVRDDQVSPIAIALMTAIIAQQVIGPVRRVSYQSAIVWLSVGACLLLMAISALCLFERISLRSHLIGSAGVAVVLCAAVIFVERGRGRGQNHNLAAWARSYGVPLLPSAFFAWIPIGVSGLAISLSSSAQDAAYFKGVVNLIIPAQVLIAANQARLVSAGTVPTLAVALRNRKLVAGVMLCSVILLAAVPWVYETIYRMPPRSDIYLVTSALMAAMAFQAAVSVLGAKCRIERRTDRVSASYGVGAIVSLPAIVFAYLGGSPIAGATAAMLGSGATMAYLLWAEQC